MAVERSEQERLDQLRRQFESDPENMENAISLAEMYSDLGWISESEEIYSHLAVKYPEHYSIQLAYGNICYNKKLIDESLKIFTKLTEMKPDRVEAWNNLGIIQMNSEEIEGARKSFEKVLEIEPENHGALLNLGNYFEISGNNDKALECFKKVTEVRPDFRDGWFNYGNSLLEAGNFKDAIISFERSLRYDPLFMSALKNIGYAHEMNCDFEKSIEYYLQALEQNRTDPTIYSNIANVYKQMNKLDEATDYYQKSVKVAPRESTGWAGLREISLLEGDLDVYLRSTLAILHRLSSDEVAASCRVFRECGWYKSVDRIIKATDKLKMTGLLLDSERLLSKYRNGGDDKNTLSLYKKLKSTKDMSDELCRELMYYSVESKKYQDSVDFYSTIKNKIFKDKVIYTISLIESSKGSASSKMIEELISKHCENSYSWFLKSYFLVSFDKDEADAEKALIKALSTGFAQKDLIKRSPALESLYKKLVD